MRPFRASDVPAVAATMQDAETMAFLPAEPASTAAEAEARAAQQIAQFEAHWRRYGYGVWALEDQAQGAYLGRMGLRHLDDFDAVELLYLVVRGRWGQGLASEAAAPALRFGFESAGLERIIALALPDNRASIRVMEKAGLRFDGETRGWGLDLVRYAASREAFNR